MTSASISPQIDEDAEAARPSSDAQTKGRPKGWVHFVAGGIGGMCGAIVTSPLDVVKTRLQSDMYKSTTLKSLSKDGARQLTGPSAIAQQARKLAYTFVETGLLLRRISVQEGPKALFRGLGPTLVGVIPARSINFFAYGNGKVVIADHFNGGKESSTVHLCAAALAGIITATATNPIWVVKTRMQLLQHQKGKVETMAGIAKTGAHAQAGQRAGFSTWPASSARSTTFGMAGSPQSFFRSRPRPLRPGVSSLQMTLHILRAEGVAGLYKGLSASYLGATEGTIQWVLYEQLMALERRRALKSSPYSDKPTSSWSGTISSAGLAKVVASLITYPHEVLRTRLRQEPAPGQARKYVGLYQTAAVILREEGLASFYGGLSAHLLRVVPNAAIMFLVYETMLSRYRTE